MKIVCGKCSADVELPAHGDKIRCPSCGALFRVPSLEDGEELPHPDTFPGYKIRAIVGHGGMGTVYRAIQLSMDREVAIKVLLRKYSTVPRFVARFDREAAALAALSHPSIVAVIDRGLIDGMYYLVMEYVCGRTLRYYIKNELLSVERSVAVAIQVCQALEAAHAEGIVHRDIKPGNILVQDDGSVKVADFGIVHMIERQDHTEQERRSRLGTAKYMAPEQRGTGEVIDPRADVYALGVTLHEMLTGTLPTAQPPSALNKLVPPALDSIVEQALEEDRDQRFQSATEMRDTLVVLLDSMRLDQTPATAAIDAPELSTVACPVCQGQVPAGEDLCPHCQAALREPCYRAGCDGVNRIGAERCERCGGHLELLKRQRRAELEVLLAQADAHAANGRSAAALGLYAEILADPHPDFAPLHERAADASGTLRRERVAGILRAVAAAAVAFLIVLGAGVGSYLAIVSLLARSPSQEPPDEPVPPEPRPPTAAAAHPKPPSARRPRRSRVFRDYLVALTGDEWAKQPPAARLAAACEAASYLARGRRDKAVAKRLAAALEAIARGHAPEPGPEALDGQLAAALDDLCKAVAGELRTDPRLAPRVRARLARHLAALRAETDPSARLDVASTTLFELLASTELAHNPDLEARLLFLDASLAHVLPQDAARRVSDRLLRSARLLVRYLRRQGGDRAVPELLEDAARRAASAQREAHGTGRLACALESLVEGMGSAARVE